jgi:hypothetical protein
MIVHQFQEALLEFNKNVVSILWTENSNV